MVKRILLFYLSVMIFTACLPPRDGEQGTIITLAEQRSAALLKKDTVLMNTLLADNFMYTNATGQVFDKTGYIHNYLKSPAFNLKQQKMDSVEVIQLNDSARITFNVHDIGTYNGETFDARYHSSFTWVKNNDRWQCVSGETKE